MKRVLVLAVVLTMVVSLLAGGSVLAAETSGTCGVNVNWRFDEQSGTLTISGNGVIDDQRYDALAWEKVRDKITAVVVEQGILGIGNNAFWGLPHLTEVSLPEGLQSVNDCAFGNCTALGKMVFPDSVWAVGQMVLEGCTSLVEVKLPKGMKEIPGGMFRYCTSLSEFEFPDTVTEIGPCAFEGTGLVAVSVPGSVKRIGSEAFSGCNQLQSVQMSEGVEEFGAEVFAYCEHLKELEFPASVWNISAALRSNSSLEKITFRGNAPLGADLLHQELWWNKNVTIYYPLHTKTWTEEVFSGYGDQFTFVGYEPEEPVSSVVATGACGDSARWSLSDEYVMTISGSGEIKVDSLKEGWKSYESKVRKVVIQDGITAIGAWAFQDFVSLEEVTIPDSVTVIDGKVFDNCEKLTYMRIPAGVKELSGDFSGCTGLERVDILGDGVRIGKNTFFDCVNLTEIHIIGDVGSFDEYAFNTLKVTVYYPAGNDTWTDDVKQNYRGDVTWNVCPEHEDMPKPTEPMETEPSTTEFDPKEEQKEPMRLYWIIVVAAAVLVAGGAVAMVLVIRRKR